MDGVPDFLVELTDEGGTVTVRAQGDVDLATVDELDRALAAAVQSGQPRVAIDLGAVTFFGSEGVRALVDVLAFAAREERSVEIVAASAVVRRVLEIVGLEANVRPDPAQG